MKQSALMIRARVFRAIRDFFSERGFLEVETPLLIPANAPEEHIDPIPTLFSGQLQTSPELCMKRLLCRGHKRLFQISRCWRASERGSRHLTEFTMLEWYRSDCDYRKLMTDCIDLFQYIASTCLPADPVYRFHSKRINPFRHWPRIRVQEAFLRFAHRSVWDCLEKDDYEEVLTDKVEPALADYGVPVILMDFPAELAALAQKKPNDVRFAERFELYAGGLELANGFSELTDPAEQRKRFEDANKSRRANGKASLPLPEPFLNELSGMPPAAGIALGLDRMMMITSGVTRIDEVVSFIPEEL